MSSSTAEGLPQGLVASNTEVVSEGIERNDRVNEDDLARLWRAYSTNRTLLANDVGSRLENFFWRIWGSRRCRERLRGSQVAFLFALISEGEIIRTTPIPSPRSSRIVTRTSIEQQMLPPPSPNPESPISPTVSPTTDVESRPSRPGAAEASGVPPTIEEEKGRRRSSSRPPPILKKRGTDSGSKKTATILTPTWKTGASDPAHDEADDVPRKPSLKGSSLSSVETLEGSDQTDDLLSPTSIQGGRASSSKAKKKPAFVVGASSAKRRPAMTRRKSSQSSSGGTSKAASPKPPSGFQPLSSSRREESRVVPSRTQRPTSRSVSPVSSSPFKRPPRDHLPLGAETAIDPSPTSQDWLVDRNFRASFVDGIRGSTTLSSKSSAATSLSTSFQARGTSFGSVAGKGKDKAVDEEDLEGLSLERLPSQALEEEEDEELPSQSSTGVLPRVKSQLTMMLQDKKQDKKPKDGKKGEASSKGRYRHGKK